MQLLPLPFRPTYLMAMWVAAVMESSGPRSCAGCWGFACRAINGGCTLHLWQRGRHAMRSRVRRRIPAGWKAGHRPAGARVA